MGSVGGCGRGGSGVGPQFNRGVHRGQQLRLCAPCLSSNPTAAGLVWHWQRVEHGGQSGLLLSGCARAQPRDGHRVLLVARGDPSSGLQPPVRGVPPGVGGRCESGLGRRIIDDVRRRQHAGRRRPVARRSTRRRMGMFVEKAAAWWSSSGCPTPSRTTIASMP